MLLGQPVAGMCRSIPETRGTRWKKVKRCKPTKWWRKKKEKFSTSPLGSLRGPLVFIPPLEIVKYLSPSLNNVTLRYFLSLLRVVVVFSFTRALLTLFYFINPYLSMFYHSMFYHSFFIAWCFINPVQSIFYHMPFACTCKYSRC